MKPQELDPLFLESPGEEDLRDEWDIDQYLENHTRQMPSQPVEDQWTLEAFPAAPGLSSSFETSSNSFRAHSPESQGEPVSIADKTCGSQEKDEIDEDEDDPIAELEAWLQSGSVRIIP